MRVLYTWMLLGLISTTSSGLQLHCNSRSCIARPVKAVNVLSSHVLNPSLHRLAASSSDDAPITNDDSGAKDRSADSNNFAVRIGREIAAVWDFTRPHTILGSGISVLCLFLFAVPAQLWRTRIFFNGLLGAIFPSLLMNLYITGLNQVTDVDIDKVNKPYLPIAAGRISERKGKLIILLALFLSLRNIASISWPLQMTLLGSAFLGTIYSMPPFRLKRFPLLAAFCILVVRGTLVNTGFYLQAKMDVMGANIPNLQSAVSAYPESALLSLFFAIFGIVIALMKDVPDIRGDVLYKIPSFSVRMGAAKIFRTSWKILYVLLMTTSAASLISSRLLDPILRLFVPLTDVVRSLDHLHSGISWALNSLLATPVMISKITKVARLFISGSLFCFANDVRDRALMVEAEDPDKVFSFYMHVWNIFYACYFLLPILRL